MFRCSVEGCGRETKKDGVTLFRVPFEEDDGEVQQNRRQQWISFIAEGKFAGWKPSKSTRVCSLHFASDAFEDRFIADKAKKLESDTIGIAVFPTIHDPAGVSEMEMSPDTRRKVRTVTSKRKFLKSKV